jgi:hypothetical protein
MRKRTFLMLVAATAASVAAAGHNLTRHDRATAVTQPAQPVFPGLALHLGELAWLRLAHGTQAIDFAAIDGVWTVVEKGNYPAAQARVSRLLRGLADLTLVEPKTQRPALYGRLGLDDPPRGAASLVSLQERTGKTIAELAIGRAAVRGTEVYVRRAGDAQTWLARGTVDATGDTIDWLDRRIMDIARARIAAATFIGVDGARVTLRRDAPDAAFAVAAPSPGTTSNAAALALAAGALENLELADVRPVSDLPIPSAGVAAAKLSTFDGLQVELRLFRRDSRDWLAAAVGGAGSAAAEAAALNTRLRHWLYVIPPERAMLLRPRLQNLPALAKGS